ncbi:MAG TPA: hypothetical protein VE129_06340, partial [Thermoanaerobaculia bacterium]|nr:hypothetical protein [Thermoanaerobaculia bacterium]
GETSSREASTPADGHRVALTVKPADCARMSNFVFALDHFTATPQHLGTLFLDLERYLHPPGEREGLEGAPDAIAHALDAAFRRGLERFEAWARTGLHWIYLQSNFSLDGRFLDLETPLFFGAPFVGAMVEKRDGEPARSLVGFEEFGYVRHWRLFVAWLRARLRLLMATELLGRTASRHFLRELSRAIASRLPRQGLLFDDARLRARATANLSRALDLGPRGRSSLGDLARHAFSSTVYGFPEALPDAGWRPLAFQPAPATPNPRRYEAPAFFDPGPSPDGQAYATALERLGSICEPRELLRSLGAVGFAPQKAGRPPFSALVERRARRAEPR